jgi:predicted regulator of Ras-like GTPase activity (Roadblock/LC7/MglB family)
MSRLDEAKAILENFQSRLPDINDLAIARTNGLIITSLSRVTSTDNKSERLIGGMASALFSISKRAAEELLKGEFISLTTEITTGNIFLIFTGKVILIVLTKKEPNLGLISLELEEAAKNLNTIFE